MSRRRPKLPITLTIDGRRRHIIAIEKTYWTEREPSGRLVHHVGKVLLDGQPEVKLIEKPRKCGRCKGDTFTTTKLGRPIHDTCEGWLNVLPDDLNAQVIFGVAVDLGATILTPEKEGTHRGARAA